MLERAPFSRRNRARGAYRTTRTRHADSTRTPTQPPQQDRLRCALHDRLGPGLANLEVRLELLEAAMTGPGITGPGITGPGVAGPGGGREAVAALRSEAGRLVGELHRIVHDEPPALLDAGLKSAISQVCHDAERPGLSVRFRVVGAPRETPTASAELLYRAALEGTANVIRHAGARRCTVTLRFCGSSVALQVRDDGVGPYRRSRGAARVHHGLGIASLRQSARLLGGQAHLLAVPTGGSSLLVTLPLHPGRGSDATSRDALGRY